MAVYLEWYQAWYTAFRKRPVRHKERKVLQAGIRLPQAEVHHTLQDRRQGGLQHGVHLLAPNTGLFVCLFVTDWPLTKSASQAWYHPNTTKHW
jgi:hypothetical protein